MTQQASTPDALIERLRARTAGPKCNADGTYTVGNCPPDALCREAAAEIERLRADAARLQSLVIDYAVCCGELSKGLDADSELWGELRALGERIPMGSAIDAAMRDAL